MKALLVNTPYIKLYGPLNVGGNFQFPLGLGYIASYLRENGIGVSLLDPEAQGMSASELAAAGRRLSPDVIGISSATPNFPAAVGIARLLKEAVGCPVVLGGVHASAFPGRIAARHAEFDYVVAGEGERTMLDLCRSLEGKIAAEDVKGIAFRRASGTVTQTPPREFITALDELPFPARDLLPMSRYRPQVYADLGEKSISMITSRGCPAACTFCASHVTMGRRFRAHSVGYMISEIEECMTKYGARYFVMKDDTFTCDEARLEEFCRELISRKLGIEWFCYSRVDLVDQAKLELMRLAGCRILAYGIESGNDDVLRGMKKGISADVARRAMRLANDAGFITVGSFMLGNPGEDEAALRETIRLAIETRPVLASFNRFVPYPGTAAFRSVFPRDDFEEPSNWGDFVASGPNVAFASKGLSKRQIQRWTLVAYLRFYMRASQWLWILAHVTGFRHAKAYLRGTAGVIAQLFSWTLGLSWSSFRGLFQGRDR